MRIYNRDHGILGASTRSLTVTALTVTALTIALASAAVGCGADAGNGGGATTGDTAAVDAGAGAGVDASGSADAGAPLPDAQVTTPANILLIANTSIALWADDGTKRVAFMPESKSGKELLPQDCSVEAPGGNGGGDCGNEKYDPAASAKDIKSWFVDHLLAEKFVDSKASTDTSVVVCMTAESLCGTSTDSQGNETTDAKCAAGVAKEPVCVAMTHHGEQLISGELRIGAAPTIVPATFTLNPAQISVSADLAKLLEAATRVNKAMDEKLPEGFPAVATGTLRVVLSRDAASSVLSAVLAIDTAAHVSAFDKTDARFYDVKVAAAAQALKVLFGADKSAVTASVGLGAIDVGVALDLMFGRSEADCSSGSSGSGSGSGSGGGGSGDPCGNEPAPKPLTGTLFAALAGLQMDLTFTAGEKVDSVTVTGLSFGPKTSTVSFDDGSKSHALLSLDLNGDATPARKMDLKATYDGSRIKLETTPKLDVVVGHTLAVLAPQFDGDIPAFLHAGTSSVKFDGATVPTFEFDTPAESTTEPIPAPKPGPGGTPDPGSGGSDGKGDEMAHMKVLAGLLTLKAVGLPTGMADVLVTIKAGMCIGEKPKAPAGGTTGGGDEQPQHVFSQLTEAACKL